MTKKEKREREALMKHYEQVGKSLSVQYDKYAMEAIKKNLKVKGFSQSDEYNILPGGGYVPTP